MIATRMLRKAMHEIADRKGEFTLFALFMRADAPGTWDLVVSAPWIERDRLKTTREFVRLLVQSIGEEALQQFSRVAAVESDHPAVKFILDNLPVDDDELRVRSTDLFGLQIEEAIIFRARRPQDHQNALPDKVLHRRPVSHRADR